MRRPPPSSERRRRGSRAGRRSARGAAPQVADDTAELREQRVAEHPAVRRGRAARERGTRPYALVYVEDGHDRGSRPWAVPGVQSTDDLAGTTQQRDARGGPSAGSSMRARGLADAADRSADVDTDAAEDGANPKVTVLPSATRPHCGRGRNRGAHTAAEPYRITDEPCGERTSILPVEPECGNEQLGPPTVIWWCEGYIPTQCVTGRRMGRPAPPGHRCSPHSVHGP